MPSGGKNYGARAVARRGRKSLLVTLYTSFVNGGRNERNMSDVNPFRAPEPLPILNPSKFVPKNGFPVV